ncbi:MAG: hypothetical protein IT198_11715 [Acidimicrobiia bacterium]|nr:hypothetical protein [Acidimicrobiia bacterium]
MALPTGPSMENLVRLRPLNPAEILDVTAIVFLRAPLTFLGVAFLLLAAPRVLLLLLEIVAARAGAVFDPSGAWATGVRVGIALTIVVGLGLCSVVIARLGNDAWFGTPTESTRRMGRVRELGRAVPVLVVYALVWSPVFVAAVPAWSWPNDWVPAAILAWALPLAVTLSVPLSLLAMTRLAEGCSTLRGVGRSFQLTSLIGFFRLALAYFVLGFLVFPLLFAVSVGAEWVVTWLDLLDGSIPALTVNAAMDVLSLTLVAALVMLVPVAAYTDARIRREGLDIQMLAIELQQRRRVGRA